MEKGKKAYVSFTKLLLAGALEVEPLPSPPFAAFLAASSFSSLCFCKLTGCTSTRNHFHPGINMTSTLQVLHAAKNQTHNERNVKSYGKPHSGARNSCNPNKTPKKFSTNLNHSFTAVKHTSTILHGIVSAPLTLLSMASALLIISRIVSWAASDRSVDASFNSFSAIGFASTSAIITIDSQNLTSAQQKIPNNQKPPRQNPCLPKPIPIPNPRALHPNSYLVASGTRSHGQSAASWPP